MFNQNFVLKITISIDIVINHRFFRTYFIILFRISLIICWIIDNNFLIIIFCKNWIAVIAHWAWFTFTFRFVVVVGSDLNKHFFRIKTSLAKLMLESRMLSPLGDWWVPRLSYQKLTRPYFQDNVGNRQDKKSELLFDSWVTD